MSGEFCLNFAGWKPGQRVRVKRGVFIGKEGVVVEPLKREPGDDTIPGLTVQVRAFGGKVIVNFFHAGEVERILLS